MSSQTDFIAGQGRAAYNRGDYAKALELFNRAIGRSPSVQLLDSRARCHDKLGDLKAAIQDAKKTIQLAGEDPTGYIRAGNVMVKMGKREVALEILTHGLKKVKHVGTSFQVTSAFSRNPRSAN